MAAGAWCEPGAGDDRAGAAQAAQGRGAGLMSRESFPASARVNSNCDALHLSSPQKRNSRSCNVLILFRYGKHHVDLAAGRVASILPVTIIQYIVVA